MANGLTTTGGTGTGAEVNITAVGETPVQSITACRIVQPAWYIVQFVGTAMDTQIAAVAAYIEAATPVSQYFFTSGEAAILNNTTPNILATLQALGYRRTFGEYATTQSGAFPNNVYASAGVMGYAMGANTGLPGSYFSLNNKTIVGVAAEPLSQTQVNNIMGTVTRSQAGLNGNIVLNYNNGAYIVLQPGINIGGTWFDQVLQIDMLASDAQISAMTELVDLPSVPQTDAGVALMKNALTAACARSQSRGFIAPSGVWQGPNIGTGGGAILNGAPLANGYALYAAPVATLSQAALQNRQLPPITIALIMAGSANSLGISINVQQP